MKNLNDLEFKDYLLNRGSWRGGFPKRYVVETTYTDKDVSPDSLAEYIDQEKKENFYIWGGVGSGKTQLVLDYLSENIWDEQLNDKETTNFGRFYRFNGGNEVIFWNATELLVYFRSFYSKNNTTDFEDIEDYLSHVLKGYSNIQFKYFVIDDLGAEKTSEWVQESLYLLINKFYETQKINLIITSNKSLQEIAESLGDRIASRIAEMCQIIKLEGKDRRIK